jgi:hypothetical protein
MDMPQASIRRRASSSTRDFRHFVDVKSRQPARGGAGQHVSLGQRRWRTLVALADVLSRQSQASLPRWAGVVLVAPAGKRLQGNVIKALVGGLQTTVLDDDAHLDFLFRDDAERMRYERDAAVVHDRLKPTTLAALSKQLHRVTRVIAPALRVPFLLLASGLEHLPDFAHAVSYFNSLGSQDKTLLTYSVCYRELLHEPERSLILTDACSWFSRIVQGVRLQGEVPFDELAQVETNILAATPTMMRACATRELFAACPILQRVPHESLRDVDAHIAPAEEFDATEFDAAIEELENLETTSFPPASPRGAFHSSIDVAPVSAAASSSSASTALGGLRQQSNNSPQARPLPQPVPSVLNSSASSTPFVDANELPSLPATLSQRPPVPSKAGVPYDEPIQISKSASSPLVPQYSTVRPQQPSGGNGGPPLNRSASAWAVARAPSKPQPQARPLPSAQQHAPAHAHTLATSSGSPAPPSPSDTRFSPPPSRSSPQLSVPSSPPPAEGGDPMSPRSRAGLRRVMSVATAVGSPSKGGSHIVSPTQQQQYMQQQQQQFQQQQQQQHQTASTAQSSAGSLSPRVPRDRFNTLEQNALAKIDAAQKQHQAVRQSVAMTSAPTPAALERARAEAEKDVVQKAGPRERFNTMERHAIDRMTAAQEQYLIQRNANDTDAVEAQKEQQRRRFGLLSRLSRVRSGSSELVEALDLHDAQIESSVRDPLPEMTKREWLLKAHCALRARGARDLDEPRLPRPRRLRGGRRRRPDAARRQLQRRRKGARL